MDPSHSERIAALEDECAKLRAAIMAMLKWNLLSPSDEEQDYVREALGVEPLRIAQKIAQLPLEQVEDIFGLRDGRGRVVGRDTEGTM